MDVRVKFLGGAKSVTGSKYLLEIGHKRLLVDCGLFQGLKELRLRNWAEFPVDATSIDAIILTHAHIDHSGYLPRIVKDGFSGPIYCTEATASLLEIMLKDAAKLQVEEADYINKKGYSKHNPPLPLFDIADAEKALGMLEALPYMDSVGIFENVKATFFDAGHILGSSIVSLSIEGETQQKRIVFSGDLGRYHQHVHNDPSPIDQADVLFIESTYGDRDNVAHNVENQLATIVKDTFNNGGCLLIPAFAVGRTQLLLYYFFQLLEKKLIPQCEIYIDSPMAISTTNLFKVHPNDHKLGIGRETEDSIFDYAHFKYYRSQESSISINNIESNAVIISASGMCTGGRILQHLYNRLPHKKDTLLFAGYQAEGTRGRKIQEGELTSRIYGDEIPVLCKTESIYGLSAHADRQELMYWASQFKQAPKIAFVVHGELASATHFSEKLMGELHWPNVVIPNYLESFELFTGI
ncbi:MAG: metallo-beta-lactamase family protein [Roseivirga sp.]|jgi:metallo-beta-lactamase family protein